MIAGLLINLALIALVVFGIRSIRKRRSETPIGYQLRNVFQYLVLLALLFSTASGLSGLLGMIADRADLVAADSSETALNLSLLLVGAPLLAVISWWTRKQIARDSAETATAGWNFFVTIALVASVVVTLFGAYKTLRFLFGATDYDGFALMQAVVWGATCITVHRLDRRLSPPDPDPFRHVVLAAIGLGVAAVGIGQLVAALLERVVRPGSLNAVMLGDGSVATSAISLVLVAIPVWVVYWLRGLARATESEGWRFHVVLLGVAGGLITWIVSGANLLYSIAVWFLGSPRDTEIGEHFESLPNIVGAATAGLLVWWYHRSLLAEHARQNRSEIDRTYTYVMASGGMVSSAVGVIILLSALVEAITGSRLVRGDSQINTLLFALVILIIGLPVWWIYWRTAETQRIQDDAHEITSASRRVYLITLVGVGGLIALGTGIASVYIVLRDAIEGRVSSATLRSIRFPLSTLLTSGAISLYHLGIYRHDHPGVETAPAVARKRSIVLVGPRDDELDRMIRSIGSIDLTWITTKSGSWSLNEVRPLIDHGPTNMVITLTDSGATVSELADH